MKPTQQEIIELAREAGIREQMPAEDDLPAVWMASTPEIERLVHLALERFGAGRGEPSRDMPHGWVTNWPAPNGGTRPVYHASAIKPKYGPELDNSLVSYPVFTRPGPSPTALRAEYLRGLEDAATLCDAAGVDPTSRYPSSQAKQLADDIRALKGKQ